MATQEVEEWRPVPIAEYAAFYEVSDLGRVRSLDKIGRAKAGGSRKFTGRVMRPRLGSRGYLNVYLRSAPLFRNAPVHRLVAGAFIPNPGNLPEVNHMDMVRTNNRRDNLEWATRLGNYSHAIKNGSTTAIQRKLSADDLSVIRLRSANGDSNTAIAADFEVHQSTISRIVNGLRRKEHGLHPLDHDPKGL